MENFKMVIQNVRRGRCARITGKVTELRRAREQIGKLIASDGRIAMVSTKESILVFRPVAGRITYCNKSRSLRTVRSISPRL